MSGSHAHRLPRFESGSSLPCLFARSREFVVGTRPLFRVLSVTAVAGLSGLCIGLAMPRGPVTSRQALALLFVSLLVGLVSGLALRSRWAMLLAPVAQIVIFEVTRLGASGPTVDGISLDGMFGPLSFVVGRGFYGLVGTLPMIVAAASGAALALRGTVRRERSRIGLYFRRVVTAVAALAVLGLVYLLLDACECAADSRREREGGAGEHRLAGEGADERLGPVDRDPRLEPGQARAC